jgi:hypothetical protein
MVSAKGHFHLHVHASDSRIVIGDCFGVFFIYVLLVLLGRGKTLDIVSNVCPGVPLKQGRGEKAARSSSYQPDNLIFFLVFHDSLSIKRRLKGLPPRPAPLHFLLFPRFNL